MQHTTATNANATTLRTLITPHYNYNSTTLQLRLHYDSTTTPLHYTTTTLQLQLHYNYNYNYSRSIATSATATTTTTITLRFATPHYILQLLVRWPLQPLQKSQPPFGPSVDLLCHPCTHQCITTTHSSRIPIWESVSGFGCRVSGCAPEVKSESRPRVSGFGFRASKPVLQTSLRIMSPSRW